MRVHAGDYPEQRHIGVQRQIHADLQGRLIEHTFIERWDAEIRSEGRIESRVEKLIVDPIQDAVEGIAPGMQIILEAAAKLWR